MSKYVKKTTSENKNFLASEVGLRMVTYQFDDTGLTADSDGKKIKAAGTIIDGKGVVFEDVDVTEGAHEGSLIVAGHILNDKLPTAATSSQKTAFQAIGLFFESADVVSRKGLELEDFEVAISTDGGTATFDADDVATHGDGLTLTITAASVPTDKETTVAVESGTVTVTASGAADGNETSDITVTLTDSLGSTYDVAVGYAVTNQA